MNEQEQIVSKFAALLGTRSIQKDSVASSLVNSDPVAASARELLLCLSKSVESHEVICTLPSLDMRKVEDDTGVGPLPKVGEHRNTDMFEMMAATEEKAVPQMAASVLNNAADASAKAAQVEQKAAQSLGSLTSWTKSSVVYASTAIARNVSDSFSSLVDSRVRAWTLLLLRHSLTTGDSASRSRLLSMLSSIIKVHSARTDFKTIPLPESAAGHPKEVDVILPLLLEVEMQVSIQNKVDTVTLRAPGTIAGTFEKLDGASNRSSGLVKVDIRLDTGAMLDSMVQQARMVVFKAVAKATSASESGSPIDTKRDFKVETISEDETGVGASTTLSGFSNALKLSPDAVDSCGTHQPGHRLQKARSSALKLNSVLHGDVGKPSGSAALDKTRKSRILKVKNSAVPSPKRQRVADTTARLRSFKSFGRPHAGDFGSGPRNATFGDFGRKPIWGRDGKLANHPTPINPNDQSQNVFSTEARTTRNATFDFQRPPIHLSSGLDIDNVRGKKAATTNPVPPTIPRTAT
eukprot:CAMPEP_0170441716 /NCGR_PEP_ID=MMETSP0117_2-20130122/47040_1 /TAXON_ID=400756 /ORGANISM="Durinskia baltica, Strain CSIRO CS-38" /LENGTH=520 /DNA_ID=CAMNT_0010702271 /DNA_START=50 /DNA_END=1608 /DNA_ORIENTATION=-